MKALWKDKLVGEVLRLEYGKPLDDADRKPDGLYPVYGANGEIDRSDKYFFDKPSIIVGRKGSAGEVNLTEEKFWPLDVTYFVTFDERQYELRFLYYLLMTLDLPSLAKGVKPGINRNEVYSQITKIPPFPEQQRIVGILDKAFEGIATAKANAEKNLKNARAIFESHLQSVFSQRGEGWVEKKLGELCSFSSGGTPSKTNRGYWNGNIPWVSGRDMKSTRLSDTALHISQNAVDESSTCMAPTGALLILVRGMGLAHGAQIAELIVPCAFNQDIRAIQPNHNISSRFLLFALRTRINHSENVLSNAAHGTLKIDMDELRNVAIPVPSLDEQQRIVRQIDVLSNETRHLESIYQQKLGTLEALKKSLLHQAFNGKL